MSGSPRPDERICPGGRTFRGYRDPPIWRSKQARVMFSMSERSGPEIKTGTSLAKAGETEPPRGRFDTGKQNQISFSNTSPE